MNIISSGKQPTMMSIEFYYFFVSDPGYRMVIEYKFKEPDLEDFK
jgi:hypothetical protein